MPEDTLLEMAKKACIRNVRAIDDIGIVPPDSKHLRPILNAIEQPEHLDLIETNSPQLVGHTDEYWIKFIKRDIMQYANKEPPQPLNPASWFELYCKLLDESQRQEAAMEEQLRAAITGVNNGVAKNQLQCDSGAKPIPIPKLGGMIFCREPKPKKPPPPPVTTERLRFGSGSRTKSLTGHGIMNKVRKQTREAALFRPGGRGNLSTPSHLLHTSKVTSIPKSMLPLPPRQNPAPQRVLPPNGSGPASKAAKTAASRLQQISSKLPAKAPAPSPMSMEERERRLRALTQRQNTASEINSTSAPSVRLNPANTAQFATFSAPQPPPLRAPTQQHASKLTNLDVRTQNPQVRKRAPADPLMPAKRRRIG